MKENIATVLANGSGSERLDQAPHVLTQLIDVLRGTLQLSPTQYQQVEQHLTICIHCQVFVELSLLSLIEDTQTSDNEATRQLFARWLQITHATWQEAIPAYVDALLAQGAAYAQARFPLLATHMRTCQHCQAEVSDIFTWLSQLDDLSSNSPTEQTYSESLWRT